MLQPYYMIEFTAVSCLFEMRVNDIPVICMNMKNQISTRIPVNYAITESGKQHISIKMLPVLGNTNLLEGSELKYKLELFDTTNGFKYQDEIISYQSQKIKKDEVKPIVINENIFVATIPYKVKDFWKEGQDLKDVDNLREKLEKAYSRLSNDISTGNYDIFKKRLQDREDNMVTSMYIKPNRAASRINNLIDKFSNGYNVLPLIKDSIIVYSAYGKKASLKKLDGDPILTFVNREKGKQLLLDVEFYLPQNTVVLEVI
ncbi:hypothetical protein [Ascidiimonas sp. W6]|uniref:hypothetical protein n=1 Tax=Ascidiimonas meishanensis TaxID=3128903 RepID=UPI0030EC5B72